MKDSNVPLKWSNEYWLDFLLPFFYSHVWTQDILSGSSLGYKLLWPVGVGSLLVFVLGEQANEYKRDNYTRGNKQKLVSVVYASSVSRKTPV